MIGIVGTLVPVFIHLAITETILGIRFHVPNPYRVISSDFSDTARRMGKWISR